MCEGHAMEGIKENADELGENILDEFAPVVSASGSVEDTKYRWAAKFSPAHMYCSMKGYEDILRESYGTSKPERRHAFLHPRFETDFGSQTLKRFEGILVMFH